VSTTWEGLANEPIQQLLKLGVIVRPMTSFGLERALRVTVGTPEENARLLDALRVVLGKDGGRS
jgi:histidinol-phosphate aminotransferase